MRLWSLHPQHLDAKGLVALWREALLAKAVLNEQTKGYRHHPQLQRFQAEVDPRAAINTYLIAVQAEATRRGYRFDASKLEGPRQEGVIVVHSDQMAYEWQHLLTKLSQRDPAQHARCLALMAPQCHPMFVVQPGPIASWEIR